MYGNHFGYEAFAQEYHSGSSDDFDVKSESLFHLDYKNDLLDEKISDTESPTEESSSDGYQPDPRDIGDSRNIPDFNLKGKSSDSEGNTIEQMRSSEE